MTIVFLAVMVISVLAGFVREKILQNREYRQFVKRMHNPQYENIRELIVTVFSNCLIVQVMQGNASCKADSDCSQLMMERFDGPDAWRYVLSIIGNIPPTGRTRIRAEGNLS